MNDLTRKTTVRDMGSMGYQAERKMDMDCGGQRKKIIERNSSWAAHKF